MLSKMRVLGLVLAALLIVFAERSAVAEPKSVIDPATNEVFVVFSGKLMNCRTCLPRAGGTRRGPTTVVWPTGNFEVFPSRWVPCASEIVRAYEQEIGGDPNRITMPVEEFLRRQKVLIGSAGSRCEDSAPAF